MASKRYWLFIYEYDEALGGMNDFVKSFDSIQECQEFYKVNKGGR